MPATSRWRGCTCAAAPPPEPGDARTVAINEAFAEANAVTPGTDVRVVLNGRVQSFQRRRHRAVARIRLCGEAGHADPGRPLLRHPVGRPQRGGGRLRHEGRLQRRDRVAGPGHRPEAGDRRARPPARALRFGRRRRAAGSAVQPFPRGRTQPAEGDVDHDSLHLLRRRGVPAQRRARAAGDRAARADRRA